MSGKVSTEGLSSSPDIVSDAPHLGAGEEMLLGLLVGCEVDLLDVGLVSELSDTESETELVDGVGEVEEGVDEEENAGGHDKVPFHFDDSSCSTDPNGDEGSLVEEKQL